MPRRQERPARADRADRADRAAQVLQAARAVLRQRKMAKKAFLRLQAKYRWAASNYMHAEREIRRLRVGSKVLISWTLRTQLSINLLNSSAFLIDPHRAGRDEHLFQSANLIQELAAICNKRQVISDRLSLEASQKQLLQVMERLATAHSAVFANRTGHAEQIRNRNLETISLLTELPVCAAPNDQHVHHQVDQSSTDSDGGELVVFKVAGKSV